MKNVKLVLALYIANNYPIHLAWHITAIGHHKILSMTKKGLDIPLIPQRHKWQTDDYITGIRAPTAYAFQTARENITAKPFKRVGTCLISKVAQKHKNKGKQSETSGCLPKHITYHVISIALVLVEY